jgi:hypothetical protein
MALGLASHFVARQPTFGRFSADSLIRTLDSQIRRNHYLFAFDTTAAPARVVGYFGWALYDHAAAEAFAATGVSPRQEFDEGGDVIWLMTAASLSRPAFFALMKATRALYPHHRAMAVRNRPDGRRAPLDQDRARVRSRMGL